jgi:hypothetical protein
MYGQRYGIKKLVRVIGRPMKLSYPSSHIGRGLGMRLGEGREGREEWEEEMSAMCIQVSIYKHIPYWDPISKFSQCFGYTY